MRNAAVKVVQQPFTWAAIKQIGLEDGVGMHSEYENKFTLSKQLDFFELTQCVPN